MASSSTGLHEPSDELPTTLRDRHRAIVSLMEELEAVDWYDQRAHACKDPELRALMEHNRDDEKEHAAMLIEWLRRHDETFDAELRERLFRDGSIAPTRATPAEHDAVFTSSSERDRSLGIGSLKQTRRQAP